MMKFDKARAEPDDGLVSDQHGADDSIPRRDHGDEKGANPQQSEGLSGLNPRPLRRQHGRVQRMAVQE
jgi:hypothetical protein